MKLICLWRCTFSDGFFNTKRSFSSSSEMIKYKVQGRIEKRLKEYNKNPLRSSYKPRLTDVQLSSPIWKFFPKQKDAMDHAKSIQKERPYLFSVELAKTSGARKYVVSSLEEFWTYYKDMPPGKRHFYELIQSDVPCHLYFDLEYDRTANPANNSELLIESWISYTCHCLMKELNVECTRANVIELDSTTPTKFSHHLIWHMPNAAFKNNLEAGKFVHKICHDLSTYSDMKSKNSADTINHWIHSTKFSSKVDSYFVDKSDGTKELFVDRSVYSRNRNFRLYLSSKKMKMVELKLSPHSQFNFKPIDLSNSCCMHHRNDHNDSEKLSHEDERKLIFYASFITNVHVNDNLRILEMPAADESYFKFDKWKSSKPKPTNTEIEKILPTHYDDCTESGVGIPFKDLHSFVTQYVQKYNANARIRRSSYNQDDKVIFYDIEGTRYCNTVGREHKSNGIYLVINLNQKCMYHHCYDHDCRSSNSKIQPFPLPQDIIEKLSRHFDFDLNDEELVKQVEAIERSQLTNNN